MERWLLRFHFSNIKIYDQTVKVLKYGYTGNQVLLCWRVVCRGEECCLQRTWVSEPPAQHSLCSTPAGDHHMFPDEHRGALTTGRLVVSGLAIPWTDLLQGCQLPLLSFSSLFLGSLRLKERVSHQSRLFMSIQQKDIKVKNFGLLTF